MLFAINMTSLLSSVSAGYVHVYISNLESLKLYLATNEDKSNPKYTDSCLESTGAICSYCCIISMGSCSRDIRACNPVYGKDFTPLLIMLAFVCSMSMTCTVL